MVLDYFVQIKYSEDCRKTTIFKKENFFNSPCDKKFDNFSHLSLLTSRWQYHPCGIIHDLPDIDRMIGHSLWINYSISFNSRFPNLGAFTAIYIYTPELFPTVLRSTGMNFGSALARIGSISAPFVIEIKVGPYECLPFLIFAAVGLASSVSVILFAFETKDKPFLTTVEEFKQAAKTKEIQENRFS